MQQMLLPLNLMQNVTLCPKYRIKDNFIAPNSIISKCFSFCGSILYISLFFYRSVKLFLDFHEPGKIHVPTFYSYYYCLGFVLNFIQCITQSDYNVKFVLMIQDVHRVINDKCCFSRLTFWSWFTCSFVTVLFIICYMVFHIALTMPLYYIPTCLLIMFDFQMIYAIRLIRLLEIKIYLWEIEILGDHDFESSESKWFNEKMFKIFTNIFECYRIYQKSFKFFVSSRTVIMFI